MSSEEELNELEKSGEIVEIKNRVGEKFKGLIVSVKEDLVIYKGLKISADGKGYIDNKKGHTVVMTGEDSISDIRITKLPEEIERTRIRASIDIIERNEEKEKKEEKLN